jgi:hypothetical protein
MKPEQIANMITEDLRSNNGLVEDIALGMPIEDKVEILKERLGEAMRIGNIKEINKIIRELENFVEKYNIQYDAECGV